MAGYKNHLDPSFLVVDLVSFGFFFTFLLDILGVFGFLNMSSFLLVS